jgi:hypothetical protein
MEGKILLQWNVDVITADHDGYCSGADNEEEFSTETMWYSYTLRPETLNMLNNLYYRNLANLFNDAEHQSSYFPSIKNEPLDGDSMYCSSSEHGLQHEIQRTPVKVSRVSFELVRGHEILVSNEIGLQTFLSRVQETNVKLGCIFQDLGVPVALVQLILMFYWNIQ